MDSPTHAGNNSAISVACLNCRDKHLKCDGNPEGCGRCRDLALFCHFVPSRRGRRGQPYKYPCIDGIDSTLDEGDSILNNASLNILTSTDLSPSYVPEPQGPPQMNKHLVKVFFEYFHPAHPILPPFDLWIMSSPPQYLINIVEFIGLHHISPGQVPECSNDLWAAMDIAELALEKAQAYLLLSILFHGRRVPEHAKECIGLAIQCSFRLGLHCRELSDTVEMQNPSRSESMRRTLWEIFIVDTILAALQVGGALQFKMEIPDVSLPSEDECFLDGHSGLSSISANDLPRRVLLDDDRISSLAYRVEATLILRQCFIACESHAPEGTLEVLDSTISAWFHRWPSANSTILQPNGKVNQIDLQTAMIMHCACIYLHFSKSFLVSLLPNTSELFCSRPPSISAHSSKPQMHTAKIVNSAVELSKLASLSTCVTCHTPFFACTLVLSSIVQVAVLTAPVGLPFGMHYSYLALNIGVLKSMGNIWGIAASSLTKLRAIAREVEQASQEAGHGLIGSASLPPCLQS
ncbi:hypothetical protein N7532_002725 [Penicillium argentinense]|uniref:Zn(2)-C6 fungal-type domain-containing protein n=1 Tax=Penicillium argentinense TaxID=1131581 RepID=A0A9W9G0X2_9EURO|nr:uncharacterized protein N7532_002725 [Penicillium argentinense]KAJ5110080.1 hypothetical protein N7532_002725 [Penicillium argentinense]